MARSFPGKITPKEKGHLQIIGRAIDKFFLKINHINNRLSFPLVILLSIVSYEIMKINLQIIFKESHSGASLLDNTWVFSSVVGSTLLGFFSDRFFHFSLRKPICLFGMLFSFIIGITLLHPAFHNSANAFPMFFFVVLSGLSGSYLGAARAFYLDQFHKNKVVHFAITVIFQCIPWILVGSLLSEQMMTPINLHYFAIVITLIALLTNVFFAKDKRKSSFEEKHGGNELKQLSRKYNNLRDWSIILSFFVLCVSYQLMPYLGEDTFRNSAFYQEVLVLGIGVFIGVLFAFFFLKIPTLRALQFGYAASCLYFLILAFLYWLGLVDSWGSLKYQFMIFAALGGIIWILSLKEFLIKSKLIEDGLVLGFIESVQSLGELAGAGLSTLLSSWIVWRNKINVELFFILMTIALIVVSLNNIVEYIKSRKAF